VTSVSGEVEMVYLIIISSLQSDKVPFLSSYL
jgi:hypothetical protein